MLNKCYFKQSICIVKIGPSLEKIGPLYSEERPVGPTSENPRYSSGVGVGIQNNSQFGDGRMQVVSALPLPHT